MIVIKIKDFIKVVTYQIVKKNENNLSYERYKEIYKQFKRSSAIDRAKEKIINRFKSNYLINDIYFESDSTVSDLKVIVNGEKKEANQLKTSIIEYAYNIMSEEYDELKKKQYFYQNIVLKNVDPIFSDGYMYFVKNIASFDLSPIDIILKIAIYLYFSKTSCSRNVDISVMQAISTYSNLFDIDLDKYSKSKEILFTNFVFPYLDYYYDFCIKRQGNRQEFKKILMDICLFLKEVI